ncbi:hypothetical protein [Proteus mirabilis]|uniref:hypothetical protein n=1 Tax=Proteus mirabilis TaxID=584 RepID=UPI0018C6D774|nr:hypothetical protein [Proteus mirabilis]EMA4642804.1 hypothetical protein [Proteus mirabilis]MBG5962202.1 hypothetical protein [Proteus mirabilis]MBL1397247.1 hypothetical protein [Proteus mirabilis]MBQ0656122.1 hypothetical protein [Proteus mirabilis]WVJ28449.1 hypothetical protein V1228_18810 [Proteus mirabilis]
MLNVKQRKYTAILLLCLTVILILNISLNFGDVVKVIAFIISGLILIRGIKFLLFNNIDSSFLQAYAFGLLSASEIYFSVVDYGKYGLTLYTLLAITISILAFVNMCLSYSNIKIKKKGMKMNLIKLEEITSFIIAIVIFSAIGMLLSGKQFSINMPVILLIYVITATNIVLQTFNRGGKVNHIISLLLATILVVGFGFGILSCL